MSVKSKPRPRRRTASYRPRRDATSSGKPGRRRSRKSSGFKLPAFFSREMLPGLLVAAALLIVLAALFNATLINAVEAVLRTTGLGIGLLFVAAALDARSALARPDLSRDYLRTAAGWHLLVVFGFGVLGLAHPGWTVGDVNFGEVTLGGDAGASLTSSPVPVLLWVASGAGGFWAVWPDRAAQLWGALRATLSWVWSLEIPQRTWHGISAFVTMLMPKPEQDYNEYRDGNTYVPEHDEDWDDTPLIEAPELELDEIEEEEVVVKAPAAKKKKMLVTSEEGDEPEGRQPSLPMGRPAGRAGWELPPVTNLAEAAEVEVRPMDNEARSKLIVDTLASFGVDARVVSINEGPTVTQFGVEPGWEVKTRNIAERDENGKQRTGPRRQPRHPHRGGLADARAGEPNHRALERPGAGTRRARRSASRRRCRASRSSASRCRTRRRRSSPCGA